MSADGTATANTGSGTEAAREASDGTATGAGALRKELGSNDLDDGSRRGRACMGRSYDESTGVSNGEGALYRAATLASFCSDIATLIEDACGEALAGGEGSEDSDASRDDAEDGDGGPSGSVRQQGRVEGTGPLQIRAGRGTYAERTTERPDTSDRSRQADAAGVGTSYGRRVPWAASRVMERAGRTAWGSMGSPWGGKGRGSVQGSYRDGQDEGRVRYFQRRGRL